MDDVDRKQAVGRMKFQFKGEINRIADGTDLNVMIVDGAPAGGIKLRP